MRIPTHRIAKLLSGLFVLLVAGVARSQVPDGGLANPEIIRNETAPRPAPESGTAQAPRPQDLYQPKSILPPASEEAKAVERRFVEADTAPPIELPVVLGQPKILRFKEAPVRVYIPDEEVAEFVMLDAQNGRELAINGKKVGSTSLMLWFNDEANPAGKTVISYLLRVVSGQAAEDLEADVNRAFPNSYVKIEEVGAKWVVSGQARDSAELGQILDLLAKSRGGRSVIDRPNAVNQVSGIISGDGTDNLYSATTSVFASPREQLAVAQAVAVLDTAALNDANIVNLMTIPGEQQVMLRVTVAEVNRSAARSVGLNFNALADSGRFSNTTGNVTGNILAVLDGGDINLRIEALRRLSLSRTLAEPNLVAINGQSANFQAGGQFPIPIISAGGAANNLQGVQFVPFGVQLSFIPQIQDRDVIRLQVQANVSTRDEALGANIGGGGGGGGGGGTAVPGLNSRNFATTVELRSGQTLAVAGLLQTNFGASSDRIPLWGDLPLLGFTGGVNRTSAAEQELVILVTPELVAPLDACAIPALPGHDVHEPTDIEFYLANRLESRRSRDFRSPVRTDYPKMRMPDKCCPDRYLVGGVGPTDRCCNQPAAVPHQPLPARRVAVPPAEDNSLMYEEVAP